MLTGENGIITQAQEAKENTRGGEVKEYVELIANENKMVDYSTGTKKDKQDVIDELVADKKLTEEEVELLETTDEITIGDIVIDFSILEETDKEVIGGESDITSPLIIGTKDENGEITVTNGKYTLQVGDYINYSPTDGVEATTITSYGTENGYGDQEFSSGYTGKWRVLGISEEGQIVIVPENAIKTTANNNYYLEGQTGYSNAVNELDKISTIFANGYGASGKARSVRIEDINSITGYNPANVGKYDPEQTGSGTRYGSGRLDEYGNKVTYYWKGDAYPYYTYLKLDGTTGTPGSLSVNHSENFNWYDNSTKEWKILAKSATATQEVGEEITTLESNYYRYYLNSLTDSNVAGEGLKNGTKAYETICGYDVGYFWIGSIYVSTFSNGAGFGVLSTSIASINGSAFGPLISGSVMQYSFDSMDDGNRGVRPAVYLKSDVQLSGNSTDGWTLVKN